MEERQLKNIKRYLQSEDVQERIQQYMQRGRSEATVSIGRVAQLFQLKESKLRDWETRGLLKPVRSKDITGQRQYSPAELEKLAIIKELVDEGGYAPSDIPANIEDIWYDIPLPNKLQGHLVSSGEIEVGHLHIDQRIEQAEKEAFWRFYADHVLQLSLTLICENIPDTVAGLVLPLQEKNAPNAIMHPNDLPSAGESLVGWQNWNHSFGTFLDPAPSFEYPSDFRIHPLQTVEESIPKDSTLIIVQRKAEPLTLNKDAVETIRRLLAPLYHDEQEWRTYFAKGMRNSFYSAIDSSRNTAPPGDILNGLADMVVRLGGQTTNRQDRWRFCCILLPKNSILPLQQRSLVVRAQSKYAPHKVGVTTISPQRDKPLIGLSFRAFQSGRIAYRSEIFAEDSTIAFSEQEGPIHSAIAVPIGGENGMPVAVFYIVSDELDAFSEGDQRVLRMMGRMIEDLIMTYHARQQVTHKLTDMIKKPSVVDALFEDFLSENEFIRDVMAILIGIQTRMKEKRSLEEGELQSDLDTDGRTEQLSKDVVSFIAVDIDDQSRLANRYGDRMTRNLSREIGLRIQRELSRLFTEHADCRLYHVYTDRFYLLLKSISLEHARDKAVQLRQILNGFYQIDTLRSPIEETILPDSMQTLSISVRLGVTSYHFTKLEDLLQRYSATSAVVKVRNVISNSLDKSLEAGSIEGGDVVMAWDPFSEGSGFIRWTPPKSN